MKKIMSFMPILSENINEIGQISVSTIEHSQVL